MITIAHLSDVHFGSDHPEAADALIADVTDQLPDATVVTGDLTMRARRVEFARAARFLALLPQPHMVVLGNHDIPLFDVAQRMGDPYGRYLAELAPAGGLDPELQLPGARILGLQSMPRWRWKSGRVSKRQVGLVTDVLGSSPPDSLRVLAMHHPPSLDGLERVARAGRLRRAMAGAGVDLVLAGHMHVPSAQLHRLVDGGSGRESAVVEVVSGTSASTRTRGSAASWMLIRVEEHSMIVETRIFSDDVGWRAGAEQVFPRQPR